MKIRVSTSFTNEGLKKGTNVFDKNPPHIIIKIRTCKLMELSASVFMIRVALSFLNKNREIRRQPECNW